TFNLDHWTRLVRRLAERTGVPPEAVDRFFFTQINVGSIRETMDALGLPQKRAHLVMDRYGYTGNACVAMALADADQQGLLTPGQTYFLIASGGGASFAAMAVRW
ncbi:MAG: 3-oxoacyl-[acyl-carrier-protein] synthase III C-terminal domain-containing protein, partial [Bacteroidota bacterium]